MALYKKGKNWYIDFYVKGQRKRKKIGPSKQLAQLALKDVEVKLAKGEYLGIYEEKKIAFKDFAGEYLEYCKTNKSPRTYEKDKTSLLHLVRFFGDEYLFDITLQRVEKYKAKRLERVKPSTLNKEISALKAMLNRAVEWGYIKSNPASLVKKVKEALPLPRFLSSEEIEALLEFSTPHIRPIIVVALNTGMRKSELLNLEWRDIDFKNRVINVDNKEDHHVKNYEPRSIPMNEEVYQTLKAIPRHISSSYVFCDRNGNKYGKVDGAFKRAVKRAGIDSCSIHTLRHTFISHLVMSGVDLRTVQQLGGWKDIRLVMRYSHLSKDHLKNAIKNIYDRHPVDTKTKTVNSTVS